MTTDRSARAEAVDRDSLVARYLHTRRATNALCAPLNAEDMVVQVATCASPAKWHLAHTTWFFETFILERFETSFRPYAEAFRVLFNSYYHAVGERHPRDRRGVLTRPGVGEVMAYRDVVDERIATLLRTASDDDVIEIASLVELGVNHEQQHQELLLTDTKLLLRANPLQPSYHVDRDAPAPAPNPGEVDWLAHQGGIVGIGHDSERFAYDNETPHHRRFLEPFELASRPVTNAEFAEFIADGGYERSLLWLDEGWSAVQRERWERPLYWDLDAHTEFTMFGTLPIDPHRPVAHLSFFEADAFARWAGARLPTEHEWEHAASERWSGALDTADSLESGDIHPKSASAPVERMQSLAGGLWEWTRSAHEPYPGYAPLPGAIGEYNGKFMCGSFVLRGGSCATPRTHIRHTYRNFFSPESRWQFAGLRLARSV